MWYLKVSSSLLIAVALIGLIQNEISLTNAIDVDDQWTKLIDTTEPKDLKKISERCLKSVKSLNEKLQNAKISTSNKLLEPTTDIVKLANEVKSQVQDASTDIATIKKLVQNVATRFKDTFKSTVLLTEVESELAKKELDKIQRVPVDKKNPVINRITRSFGNRYDLKKSTNEILTLSSNSEILKDNKKKQDAKKEFSLVWRLLNKHAKNINDDTLKALDTFIKGMKSMKSLKKNVKLFGDTAMNNIKEDDLKNLRNAVEAAKALKLKFEEEWDLDSGELTDSQEKKIENSKTDEEELDPQSTEQEETENDDEQTEDEIPKSEIQEKKTDYPTINQVSNNEAGNSKQLANPNKENNDKQSPQIQDDMDKKTNSSLKESPIDKENPLDSENDEEQQSETLVENPGNKKNSSKKRREKTPLLSWEELIKQQNPRVSEESKKCLENKQNTQPAFDKIKAMAKSLIQEAQKYDDLKKKENETIDQYYNNMIGIKDKLANSLINAADDICIKVTPLDKKYEIKFKNDKNIQRIQYLLSKKYDPNQYISKILKRADDIPGIGGMKKTSYYKMLSVGHNLKNEAQEMDDSALYAMNKIHEGKLAANDLNKMINKEKVSKACYIRNILLAEENEDDKKKKEENKNKVNESRNENNIENPLKPAANFDSVDQIEQPQVTDDDKPKLSNGSYSNEISNSTRIDKSQESQSDENNNNRNIKNKNTPYTNLRDPKNTNTDPNNLYNKKQNQDKNNNTNQEDPTNYKSKINTTKKQPYHIKHKNPDDPNDHSEEENEMETEENSEENNNEQKSPKKVGTKTVTPHDNSNTKTEPIEKLNNQGKLKDPKTGEEISEENDNDAESLENSPETAENSLDKVDSKTVSPNDNSNTTEPKKKWNNRRKRKDPKTGAEISEEIENDVESLENSPETAENSPDKVDSKTVSPSDNSNTTIEPKKILKRHRKRKDPKTGEEISEENYNDTESLENSPETAENSLDKVDSKTVSPNDNSNTTEPKKILKRHRKRKDPKTGEEISEENDNDVESLENSPETAENSPDKVDSKTVTPNDNSNTITEPKNILKRHRKLKDPKTGEDISEENDNDTESLENSPETAENSLDKVDSKTVSPNDNSNTTEPKKILKRHRKRKDPKTGEEISEENDNDIESLENSPETAEISPDKVDSKTVSPNDNSNTTEPKKILKRHRKRKDPKTGEEISEENDNDAESLENSPETAENSPDKVDSKTVTLNDNSNIITEPKKILKRHRKRKDPKTGEEISEENDNDIESLENSPETAEISPDKVDSKTVSPNDNSNTTEPKKILKRHRKRKDPKTGEEISEENDNDAESLENSPETAENSPDKVDSKTVTLNDNSNIITEPKKILKRRRKRKDPKTGAEISEENDGNNDSVSENNSEDEDPETVEQEPEVESSETSPKTVENSPDKIDKKINTPHENSNTKTEPKKKLKNRRKRKDPKTGEEISEENDNDAESLESSPETAENSPDKVDSKTVTPNDNSNTKTEPKKKLKRHRKRRDPKTGEEIAEENENYDNNNNGSENNNEDDDPEIVEQGPEVESSENSPETAENSSVKVDSKTVTPRDDSSTKTEPKKKLKNRRKHKDPRTGEEISEENENDGNNNSGNENNSEDEDPEIVEQGPEVESLETSPKTAETSPDKVDSKTVFPNDNSNTTTEPKKILKRHRKRRDPKTGEEITDENENDDNNNNENDDPEIVEEGPEVDSSENSPETAEISPDKVDSKTVTPHDNSNTKTEPKKKLKRHRKRKDPKTGEEISEENDGNNDSGSENNSEDEDPEIVEQGPEVESSENSQEIAENSPDKVDSKTLTPHDNSNTKTEPKNKLKNRRKHKDPRTGEEISEENDNDAESLENSPETAENSPDKVGSKTVTPNDNSNTTTEPKKILKRHRKRRDPKTGEEIAEENENDDNNSSGSEKNNEDEDPEIVEDYESDENNNDEGKIDNAFNSIKKSDDSSVIPNIKKQKPSKIGNGRKFRKNFPGEHETVKYDDKSKSLETGQDYSYEKVPDLYDDENLDSVERAEQNGIKNDVIPPAVSYEEDESSGQFDDNQDVSTPDDNTYLKSNVNSILEEPEFENNSKTPYHDSENLNNNDSMNENSTREVDKISPEEHVETKMPDHIETSAPIPVNNHNKNTLASPVIEDGYNKYKPKHKRKQHKKPTNPKDMYDVHEDVESYEEISGENDDENNKKRKKAKTIGDSYEEISEEEEDNTHKMKPRIKGSNPYNDDYTQENVPDREFDQSIGTPRIDFENKREQPDESKDLKTYDEPTNVDNIASQENNPQIRPKGRRKRKTRTPKNVNSNMNEPKLDLNYLNDVPSNNSDLKGGSINPYNNDYTNQNESNGQFKEPLENPQTMGAENDIEQPDASENLEYDDNPIATVNQHGPHKRRRHKKMKTPEYENKVTNEPEIDNNENDLNDVLSKEQDIYKVNPYNYYTQDNRPINRFKESTEIPETTDVENDMENPNESEGPQISDGLPNADIISNNVQEDNDKHRPRKVRRHRRLKKPNYVDENANEQERINNENIENVPVDRNLNDNTIDTMNQNNNESYNIIPNTKIIDENEPSNEDKYSENEASDNIDYNNNLVGSPHKGRMKRRRNPGKLNENEITEDPETNFVQNNNGEDNEEDQNTEMLNDPDATSKTKRPKKKKKIRRKKIITTHTNKKKTTTEENTLNDSDKVNNDNINEENSPETTEEPQNRIIKPKRKKHIKRIRTYMVNQATNEKIPVDDKTYSTSNGLPETLKNKSESINAKNNSEESHSDNSNTYEDNFDYSSFLFKEHNSDQCKRNAYDKFKKVTSYDAKQIAYRSVLDTSEMRSHMIATIKNAIINVRASITSNDVDQSLRTVSYSLKTGLKRTINDLVNKVIPLAKDFLKETENLKVLYQKGPQTTYNMVTGVLESEPTIPDSAKPILKLISPKFNVDQLINDIFDKPIKAKSLNQKRIKAEKKLIDLSMHLETATSNIDCFVLTAMSTVGTGADTLKSLNSGRVIMSDKHPRAKLLRNALGIIKSGKKILKDSNFKPASTSSENTTESDDDGDEDPEHVTQKNEEFLKTVPNLDNTQMPRKFHNRRQALGVIVVHPDKQIEYKEVTDTKGLKRFVGDQSKKYELKTREHPKFLKVNSKKLIDTLIEDIKKKADKNGMSKKEMVDEIIQSLNSK